MRIGIRVDVNKIVATGHIMRCLAIADALKKNGEHPLFILADNTFESLIEGRGYPFSFLKSDWQYMDGEVEKLQCVIERYRIEVLLIDSYFVTKQYLKKIHELTKTVYIDDLGKDIYEVDTIICYVNYYKKLLLEQKYSSKVQILQSVSYVPLRNVFSTLPQKNILSKLKKLVVLSGGTDSYNFLWNFAKKIMKHSLLERLEKVYIICGKYYDNYDKLRQEFIDVKQICFCKDVNDIEKYMLSADVAISAAGVTLYELCAVGIPTITYIMADNQYENAKSFCQEGLMEYAGDLRYDSVLDNIVELLQGKYQELEYRKKVSEAMRRKIDGKGAQRIANELCKMLYH